jgi:hypothetical protein
MSMEMNLEMLGMSSKIIGMLFNRRIMFLNDSSGLSD